MRRFVIAGISAVLAMTVASCSTDKDTHPPAHQSETAGSGAWQPVGHTDIPGNLYGVTATGAHDAWAVGDESDEPAVMRWRGGTWTRVEIPGRLGLNSLRVVAASGPGDVWVFGAAGWRPAPNPGRHGGTAASGHSPGASPTPWSMRQPSRGPATCGWRRDGRAVTAPVVRSSGTVRPRGGRPSTCRRWCACMPYMPCRLEMSGPWARAGADRRLCTGTGTGGARCRCRPRSRGQPESCAVSPHSRRHSSGPSAARAERGASSGPSQCAGTGTGG